jgi:hypothetical protein
MSKHNNQSRMQEIAKANTPSAADLDAVAAEQQIRALTKDQLQKVKAGFEGGEGFTKNLDGSIDISINIDTDTAGSLLASAEQAGIPTAEYIRNIVRDALEAFWAQTGA